MTVNKPTHPISVDWKSEEGNDQWVAYLSDYKRGGYFIEAGATKGRNNSAIVLEQEFDWDGVAINANPDHCFYSQVELGRKNVEQAALWSSTGFRELWYAPVGYLDSNLHGVLHPEQALDMSYASAVVDIPNKKKSNWLDQVKKLYKLTVPSINFTDLFEKYNSPTEIDYIGMDIEGSEYEAISTFPFDKYHVRLWSIELSARCEPIMNANGYVRVNNPFCPKDHEHHYIHVDEFRSYPFK